MEGMRGERKEKGGEGRRGEGGGGRGEEAFLVMWPRRLSALNPPLVRPSIHLLIAYIRIQQSNNNNNNNDNNNNNTTATQTRTYRNAIALFCRCSVHHDNTTNTSAS